MCIRDRRDRAHAKLLSQRLLSAQSTAFPTSTIRRNTCGAICSTVGPEPDRGRAQYAWLDRLWWGFRVALRASKPLLRMFKGLTCFQEGSCREQVLLPA